MLNSFLQTQENLWLYLKKTDKWGKKTEQSECMHVAV